MATKTLNIALDEKLIAEIDKAVKKDMGSRSEYFRRLALDDLARRQEWESLFSWGNRVGREAGVASEQQVYDVIADYKRAKQSPQD